MMAHPGRIRSIVIGIFQHDGRLLVLEGFDQVKKNHYYRPPGGAIEFGERAEDALKREIKEELGAEIDVEGFLGSHENIFVCDGVPGHEIVLIFKARFRDRSYYERDEMSGTEDNGVAFKVLWRGLGDFDDDHRLVPEGVEKFLISR